MAIIDVPDAIDFLISGVDACSARKTAIDVGAYVGEHTTHLSRRFEFVMAFEPIASNFERLEQQVKKANLVNVTVRQEALGSSAGRAVMHCKDVLFPARGWRTGPSAVGVQEVVDITTIDTLKLPDVNFIKVNTNGNEYRVVKGATETIKKCKPIILLCEEMDPHRYASTYLLHLSMKQIAVSNRTFLFGW
jgi:FkbM family methyltransferase